MQPPASAPVPRRAVLAAIGLTIIARPAELLAARSIAFTVTELPADLDNLTATYGRGINRKATVVGIATADAGPAAVRSRGKTAWSLPPADRPSIANAVNDAGLIVGSVEDLAAVWEGDQLRMLARHGDDRTAAFAVNADGVVVGSADRGANSGTALRWDGDDVTELPALGGPSSRATGINADGIIVGYSTRDEAGELVRAVQWIDDSAEELGTLGGPISQATAINRHGQIVGSSTGEDGFSAVEHAFLYVDGAMSALDRLGKIKVRGRSGAVKLDRSIALGINDDGVACGFSGSMAENDLISVATLWLDDEAIDLNSAIGTANREIVLTSADGINRDRDIVCTGYLLDDPDRPRLFRLEPA